MPESVPDADRWNHSIYYWNQVLRLVPPTAQTALDVGCGDGYGARSLAARGLQVTAVDTDARSIARAHEQDSPRVTYVVGDVLTAMAPSSDFDVVAAVAVLHHMDMEAGLERLRALVAPGGILLVVGLAASQTPGDRARDLAGAIASRVRRPGNGVWESDAPTVWPPPHTYREVAGVAARLLPGSEFRRRAMFRYTLTWTKPDAVAS